MKFTTASKYALLIGALVVAAACSSAPKKSTNADDTSNTDDGTGEDDGTGDDGTGDDGTGSTDDGTSNPGTTDPGDTGTDPGSKVCAPSCTSDSDCQNSCPETAGSTACCDLSSNTCFNSTDSTCPAPATDDAGTDGAPPAY